LSNHQIWRGFSSVQFRWCVDCSNAQQYSDVSLPKTVIINRKSSNVIQDDHLKRDRLVNLELLSHGIGQTFFSQTNPKWRPSP
jgi:hypothetical protein